MDDLTRIRYTTKHFESLQGLTMLPFAIAFALYALLNLAGYGDWFTKWQPISSTIAMVLTFIPVHFIGKYYQQKYGIVRKGRSQRIREMAAMLPFMIIFGIAVNIDDRQATPIMLIALISAVLFAYGYFHLDKLLHSMLWSALIFLLLAIVPVLGWDIPFLEQWLMIFVFVFGVLASINAIFAHLLLEKMMTPAKVVA